MEPHEFRQSPVFVINLDRRTDRWSQFQKQPTLDEFASVKRFSAVDGSKLDMARDERISLLTRQRIARHYRRSHYEINTLGAIGASLSHIGVWKRFLESSAQYCIVFEDDTVVSKKDLAKIDKLLVTLPPDWDMWLLGTHAWMFEGVPLTASPKGWWKVRQFTGAHAYILSRRGAELLLQEPFPIECHIEFYICAVAQLKGLRIIRHPTLRMTYFAEALELKEGDSDTFEDRLSCPACAIPDDYYNRYYAWEKNGKVALVVKAVTLGIVGYGLWKLMKE